MGSLSRLIRGHVLHDQVVCPEVIVQGLGQLADVPVDYKLRWLIALLGGQLHLWFHDSSPATLIRERRKAPERSSSCADPICTGTMEMLDMCF